jgi:ATP-dependent Clp endopeptidase proteolytic subunit ClpP
MNKNFVELQSSREFKIRAKSETEAEIVLYGVIGENFWGDGVSAKQFSDELNKLSSSVKNITLRINSPGGDVFDGITIYNRLKQHKAKVKVVVEGLAASIASVIMLAGDEIEIGTGALVMVHLPWTMAVGNRKDLESTIDRLVDVEDQLLNIYQKKIKKYTRAEVKKMLEDETWLDADEAIEIGLVQRKLEDSYPVAAAMLNQAKWLAKMPSIKTDIDGAKEKIKSLENKIHTFLARK